jgi:acyl carrier protein
MEEKILEIINTIRISKGLDSLLSIQPENNLRNDLEFTSFDLAELTVRIEDIFDIDIFEDGIVNTVEEIYKKLYE